MSLLNYSNAPLNRIKQIFVKEWNYGCTGYPAFIDIRYPFGYPAFIDIRYPFGYPADRVTGYPDKLLNKWCELRISKLFLVPFNVFKNKSEIATRNVGRFSWKQKFLYFLKKNFYNYYFAGDPVIRPAGYLVSGKIIGRISGQISIRYNPKWNIFLYLFLDQIDKYFNKNQRVTFCM